MNPVRNRARASAPEGLGLAISNGMKKLPVGILGATGMVGQKYVQLLEEHPWFEVAYVAASPQSAGKKYKDALKSGWLVGGDVPADVARLVVEDVSDVAKAAKK